MILDWPKFDNIQKALDSSDFYFRTIIFTMLFVPLSELFGELLYQVPFVFERPYLTFLGIIGTLIFARNIIKYKKFTIIDLFYLAMLLLAALSVSFSKANSDMPMFLISSHPEELFHYYAYFFLFYSATKIDFSKHAKYILITFIVISVLHNFLGILQLFGIRLCVSYNNQELHEQLRCIYGLTSNCNFYAGLATIFTAVSCACYMFSKTSYSNIKWLLLIFVSSFCAICSSTRLGLVGVGTTVFLTFLVAISVLLVSKISLFNRLKLCMSLKDIYEKDYSSKIVLMISVVFLSFAFVYFGFPHLLKPSLGEFMKDFSSLSSINVSEVNNKTFDNVGTLRGQVWRFAIEYLQNVNFWTGTGIGNFSDVFFSSPHMHESPQIVNFAHNEYLHIFATQGVFAFVVYIALYIICIIKGFIGFIHSSNKSEKKIQMVFLIILGSYMAQAFFNCNIFETYFYFWILIGVITCINSAYTK